MPKRSRQFRAIALLVLLPLAGCVTWSPAGMSAEALMQQPERPERVRITRTDGVRMVLERPELRAGALVATLSRGAVLTENIRLLEVERTSVARTIGLALPGLIILAVVGKEACRC